MTTFSHLWQYLAELLLEWEMFQIKVVEKVITHNLCSITFLRKSRRLCDNVEACGGAKRQQKIIRRLVACWISTATRAKAHASAHSRTYTHTCTHLRAHAQTEICNTYSFSTVTMVSRTRLNVTLLLVLSHTIVHLFVVSSNNASPHTRSITPCPTYMKY
jgi:hypothetical protein